jgi:hypothetical protein
VLAGYSSSTGGGDCMHSIIGMREPIRHSTPLDEPTWMLWVVASSVPSFVAVGLDQTWS